MFTSTNLTVLVTIPTADRDFESYVRKSFVNGSTPASFEALIRADYPLAVVRARALSGELFTVWYVYRDGGWRPPSAQDERRRSRTRSRDGRSGSANARDTRGGKERST